MVDATLSNKAILMLPWWTSYLIMLKVFPFHFHSWFYMVYLDNISVIVALGAIGGHDEALHSVWLQLLHGPGGVHMYCTEFTCISEHKISFKYV